MESGHDGERSGLDTLRPSKALVRPIRQGTFQLWRSGVLEAGMFPIALGTARQDAMISPWGTFFRVRCGHIVNAPMTASNPPPGRGRSCRVQCFP